MIRRRPALSVKRGQRHPAPSQLRVRYGLPGFHPHDHRRASLDLPDLPQLDIVGETRHQRGLQARASAGSGAETREKEEKKTTPPPPIRGRPAATLSAARIRARANWRSWAGCANGGVTAPFPPRRISMPTNVATPNNRKMKKRTRNEVSTVKIAAARIAENARMARKKASRSVAA